MRYFILLDLMHHPATEEEIKLKEEISIKLHSPESISPEDFSFYRKEKSLTLLQQGSKLVSDVFQNTLRKRMKSYLDQRGVMGNKGLYILDFHEAPSNRFTDYALKELETPKWLAYINCPNFDLYINQFLENSKTGGMLISREFCQTEENLNKLNTVLSSSSNPSSLIPIFFSTRPESNPQDCFMENMFGFFNGLEKEYCLCTHDLMLTDKDAPYIASLITKNLSSPLLKCCILEIENHLTSEGLKMIGDALKEVRGKVPRFLFIFSAKRNEQNSKGLDLLKSMYEHPDDENWVVLINEIQENKSKVLEFDCKKGKRRFYEFVSFLNLSFVIVHDRKNIFMEGVSIDQKLSFIIKEV